MATGAGLYVLLGNGDGSFQAPWSSRTRWVARRSVGDFNRDGKPDVAVISPESKTVGVFLNRSTRAAYHGIADGVWYFHMRAVDAAGGWTHGDASRAHRYPAALDPGPERGHGAEWRRRFPPTRSAIRRPRPVGARSSSRSRSRGTVLFHHTSGHVHSGVLYQTGFRCDCQGSYRFYVYATDAAGNTQGNVASNLLVVH